jgi:hypothetical protein
MRTMAKTVKVPVDLLTDLIGAAHKRAEEWYDKASHNASTNNHDIAANCLRYGDELAGVANEARRLIDLPPFPYRQ